LEHPLGTKITEAVAIGYASLDAYGHHMAEILQCMVERRAGGETGVASVQGRKGNDVWAAMDSGRISQKLVDAACANAKKRAASANAINRLPSGSMRDLVKEPYAVIVQYNDGTKGVLLSLTGYFYRCWGYAANA